MSLILKLFSWTSILPHFSGSTLRKHNVFLRKCNFLIEQQQKKDKDNQKVISHLWGVGRNWGEGLVEGTALLWLYLFV